MTGFSARPASVAPTSDHTATAAKPPRATLRQLVVEADFCPEMLPRLFGILAQQALLPLAIDYARSRDSVTVSITLAPVVPAVAALLVGRIERIVTVRRAGFATPPALNHTV